MDLSFVKKPEIDTIKILDKLVRGVIDTNKLIGIGLEGMKENTRQDLIKVYEKLLIEEASELQDAIDDHDRVEMLDAIVDTLVVGSYYLVLKNCGDFKELRYHHDIHSLEENVEEFLVALSHNRFTCLYELACDIFFQLDIDHEKAVDTVLASNLSKFPTLKGLNDAIHVYDQSGQDFTGQEIEYTIKYIEAQGRYTGVHVKCVIDSEGIERKVFWATHDKGQEKLKYVKPLTFNEPAFANCFKF